MVATKNSKFLKTLKKSSPIVILAVLLLFALVYILVRENDFVAELDKLYETQQCEVLQNKISSYKEDKDATKVYDLSYKCALQTNSWDIAKERSKQMIALDADNKDVWQQRLERAEYELSVQIDSQDFQNLEIRGQDSADELL